MQLIKDWCGRSWNMEAQFGILTLILEKVQNRAARFVTGNYVFETGSMTGILGQLKWESLKKRRKDSRLILLYKGLKGKARIPTDDLIPKNRRCRNQHSLAFQIPSAGKEAYKSSFGNILFYSPRGIKFFLQFVFSLTCFKICKLVDLGHQVLECCCILCTSCKG